MYFLSIFYEYNILNIACPTISEKVFNNISQNPQRPMLSWLFYLSLLYKQLFLIVLKVFIYRENQTIILMKDKTLIFLEHKIFPFFRKMTFSFSFDEATLFLVLYQNVSKKVSVIHKYSKIPQSTIYRHPKDIDHDKNILGHQKGQGMGPSIPGAARGSWGQRPVSL